MKKIFFISAVLVLSLASCKKDYTCVCTGNILGTTVSVTTEAKSTKKGADDWCKGLQNGTETVDGQSNATFPLTCAIK
jgi:hypothetical protein